LRFSFITLRFGGFLRRVFLLPRLSFSTGGLPAVFLLPLAVDLTLFLGTACPSFFSIFFSNYNFKALFNKLSCNTSNILRQRIVTFVPFFCRSTGETGAYFYGGDKKTISKAKMSAHDNSKYILSDSSYSWFLRSLRTLEKSLSINIYIHDEDDLLNKGQIFIFNHFARFETLIPPYIIYRETGKFCRSIADKNVLSFNKTLTKMLQKGGAVPNNLPGLLPFLAAEILRGRKVVIFPEGGMIKDKRVVDEHGQFNMFSSVSNKHRKHHKGAAVLALTLDLFKRRIQDLFEEGDTTRITHWQESLGLPSPEELLRQAQKPTVIVPSTITFHPIRITDNTLTKTVGWFSKDVGDIVADETAIEGNLLFSDTDMDIRFANPITTRMRWSWWRKALLRNYFLSVDSLDELFSLKENTARNWSEKFLAQTILKNTNTLRDQYMENLYKGITVNLGHIASETVISLMEKGINEVPKEKFHHMIYLALKRLQNEANVYLHRSLIKPDTAQENILNGNNGDLKIFLETCIHADLIEISSDSYIFREKLKQEFSYHKIRLENPVIVCANEVGPIKEVSRSVKYAINKVDDITPQEIATHLFDDELRSFSWNHKFYLSKEFDKINKKETATENPKPYLLVPKTPKKVGVLLVHGFLSSPAEMRPFADFLYKKGHSVMGVRLAGHGTSPHDLATREWGDWLESVRIGYKIISAFADEVVVIGFSAGGILSLLLAEEKPEKLVGVASVASPLDIQDPGVSLIPVLHRANKVAKLIPSVDGITLFLNNGSSKPSINYRSMPVSAINELRTMISVAKKKLKNIDIKAAVVQGTKDPVAIAADGEKIFKSIGTKDKQLHFVETDKHNMLTEGVGDAYKILLDFIQNNQIEEQKNK
jgi:esterase/lipase